MGLIISPTGQGIRNDRAGAGFFRAPRGNKLHRGVDFLGEHGRPAVSPITGYIKRIGYAYADSQTYGSIHVEGDYCTVKMLYVSIRPDLNEGSRVRQGEVIGFVQNIVARYPDQGMKNHVHTEIPEIDPLILL